MTKIYTKRYCDKPIDKRIKSLNLQNDIVKNPAWFVVSQ